MCVGHCNSRAVHDPYKACVSDQIYGDKAVVVHALHQQQEVTVQCSVAS